METTIEDLNSVKDHTEIDKSSQNHFAECDDESIFKYKKCVREKHSEKAECNFDLDKCAVDDNDSLIESDSEIILDKCDIGLCKLEANSMNHIAIGKEESNCTDKITIEGNEIISGTSNNEFSSPSISLSTSTQDLNYVESPSSNSINNYIINKKISNINNINACSEDNVLTGSLKHGINEGSKFKNYENRRNSLPENYIGGISQDDAFLMKDKDLDSISVTDLKDNQPLSHDSPSYSLPLKNKNKQVDIKEVVKNVHGIISFVGGSLKNAYKPMEKNLSGMMQATQKNLTNAKNDYFKADRNMQNAEQVVENISKYSTLNLSNENESIEDTLFKKCENFNQIEIKTSDSNEKKKNMTVNRSSVIKTDHPNVNDATKSVPDEFNNTIKNENKDLNGSHENSALKCITPDNVGNTKIQESTVQKMTDYIENQPSSLTLVIENSTEKEIFHNNKDESSNCEITDEQFNCDDKSRNEVDEKTTILERAVSEMNKEIGVLRMALIDKDTIKRTIESKMNLFMKQLETVTAERDASVVRYAVSERSALEAIKCKESAVAAEQSAKREVSMITQRLRTANAERARATAALDMKNHELSLSQREVSRCKDELQSCEVKLKWAQSKLVSEMDAHKESSALVEKLSLQLKQMEGGNASVPISTSQQNDIDCQLREKEATIILERHERERAESRCKQLQLEVEHLKGSLNSISEEARELRAQVEASAAESAALRRACSELRDQGAKDCERLAAAQARAARCDTLATHLQQEQEKSFKLTQELESMRILREEALAEGELRVRREAELLRQAERLTAAGVKLQATCSEAEAKALALTVDNTSLREAAQRAANEAAEARAEAAREREGRSGDARALASRAAQHARGEREALASLEAARGDMRVLATKHASAVKELKRELQQAKRKLERYESEGRMSVNAPVKFTSDRTGSTSSLSSYEGQSNQNQPVEVHDNFRDVQVHTPDRQQLVERIVSLQRAAAKRGEKLDFLEEHNRQLTQELQKKTRLLRTFLVAAPAGALTSPASDAAKAEIGKHGGVMASVYGSQVADETMTIELSLEINAKLQSLLEDTLLSNITLKENMDTLGDEIARLKEQYKSGRGHKE